MTPPQLALGLHSLPPILHMTILGPMPSYSKAPRGLFVLPQVARIFTGTAISPSPPPRQWPSRSTIHAGRNLPDKGLRYLRHFVTLQTPIQRVAAKTGYIKTVPVKLGHQRGRSFLPTSARRPADRTISCHQFRLATPAYGL